MIRNKLLIFAFLLMIILTPLLTACGPSNDEIAEMLGADSLPVKYVHVDFFANLNSLPIAVGNSDYVFVGYVDGYIKTTYEYEFPRTYYSIKVIDNIKGSLTTETNIVLNKEGGISKDKKKFIVHENDFLPKIREYYIFIVAVDASNELYSSGPNTNIKIRYDENYKNLEEYSNVIEAYENEIIAFNRKRFMSKFDINYK